MGLVVTFASVDMYKSYIIEVTWVHVVSPGVLRTTMCNTPELSSLNIVIQYITAFSIRLLLLTLFTIIVN